MSSQQLDDNYKALGGTLWDETGAQFPLAEAGTVTTGASGKVYAPARVQIVDGPKATYRAAISALAAVTGCEDLFTLTTVGTTKIVKILRFELSGTIATAAMYLDVLAILRSTANTAGTSTTPTVVPLDSGDTGGISVVRAYTANPSALGTAVGTIRASKVLLPLTGTPIMPDRLIWNFGDLPGAKVPTLRGANKVFAVNLAAVAIANATLIDAAIEWTEEAA